MPIFFIIYIDPIIKKIKQLLEEDEIILAYADDIIILIKKEDKINKII